MTMQLERFLTTTGKYKSKRKYRTSADAKKARELKENWQNLLNSHNVVKEVKRKRKTDFVESRLVERVPVYRRGYDEPKVTSLPFTGDSCVRPADKVYTGDKMIGIGVLHKSNGIPIFSNEEAVDLAKMRR